MNRTRPRVVALAVLASAIVLLVLVAGPGLPLLSIADDPTQDRPADPSTEDTVGYVDGYWYDDELSVDRSDDATVSEDDLEAVVSRSMARVETIRGLTFEEDVSVDVISRQEYRTQNDTSIADPTADQRLQSNLRLEALFMADRETSAIDEQQSLYDGSVAGYYDPETDEIVVVSEDPDDPALDELTLGHELVHALQDQHHDLTSYERETQDQANAKNGLIEGDAVWVENRYETRCSEDWACTLPSTNSQGDQPEPNWGLYLTIFQPYDDGPDYVDAVLGEGDSRDWDALDGAYDDPPASSSEVIRPGEDREPRDVDVEDRSSENWTQHEIDGAVANDSLGEATMVSMFAADGLAGEESVIEADELLPDGPYGTIENIDYDHEVTDGWAGDELVTYVGENESIEESGYVWETEWESTTEAEQFLEGYLELLSLHGAEDVDGHRNTFAIEDEDGYPGAYYLENDGERVTIVRGPSAGAVSEIDAGSAPEGDDTLELDADAPDSGADDESGPDDSNANDGEPISGFGPTVAVVALLVATLAARLSR
ncbi:hypothetical protein HALLA_06260 [Halostagnicola larsenii XH-48]|uniref:PGF-CTERM sorting domain-containing protein n=1 Tax=Halostagnicola larsenii XH-48 TaxID=797299 RepID=W0JIS7_9EURY|nr:Hvo_1808 family surface protein [Halostagnicola larsenii]AHF98508.1 hypothetical protein HALLA_06260 [Halostagnicola larsenii XH-48]